MDLDSNLQRVDFYKGKDKGKESDLKTQSTQPSHVFIPLSSYVITVDSNFNRFGLNQSSGQHVCVVFFEHVHMYSRDKSTPFTGQYGGPSVFLCFKQ